MLFIGVPLFWGAGTLDWPRGRLFLGLVGATLLVDLTVLLVWRPELIQQRWKRRKDTKPFDKVFGVLYLLSVLALFKHARMDAVRYRWTSMPEWTLYVGVALHLLACCPVLWALLANPYLETTVRIQKDRRHRVISGGPYRYVRHPMYAGMIPMFLGWPPGARLLGGPRCGGAHRRALPDSHRPRGPDAPTGAPRLHGLLRDDPLSAGAGSLVTDVIPPTRTRLGGRRRGDVSWSSGWSSMVTAPAR
jgi:protein-S-isoprenylcysteine O-methyltransferase Ste14